MATTTHPPPGFDITATDDMDLHSDNGGFEYNDGDIELDLEPPSYGEDEDVSIDDAVSANGMEAQAAPSGDNDDYMVDQEDVIEEDYSYQDVDVDIGAEQSAIADTITTEAQAEVQDEDLLDYSAEDDDYHDPALRSPWLQQQDSMEDEPEQTQDIPAQQDELVQTQDASTEQGEAQEAQEAQDTDIQQDETPADLQAPTSMNSNKDSQSPQARTDVIADGNPNAEHHEDLPRSQSAGPAEGDAQASDEDGGVLLKSQEEHASAETGHNDVPNTIHDYDESAQDSEHQEDASFQLPPVTVNCMGEELWLFKQHDYENNGDWLLEDASVARTSMSDLFQACRSALGHEVLNGMEIGFRFDHFQNMELFEDSTVCVAVSLERLVGYYHTLYAQDGNNEPDSFYITLMYRPRFATLLADIARYADSGRGYSGFEAAIAAGETNFHSASLGLPVEEATEWETEGQEPEQDHDEGQVEVDEHESEHEHERHASEQTHDEDANEEKNEQGVDEETKAEKKEEDPSQEANAGDQVQQDAEVETRTEEQLGSEQHEQTYEEAQNHEDREPESHYHEADDTQYAHEEGGVSIHENEEVATDDASGNAHEEYNVEEQPLSHYEGSVDAQEVAEEPEQLRSQAEDQAAAELEARRLQQEGDIIDYSDGEDEESATVEEVEQAPRTQLSPSSATVQGDVSTSVGQQLSAGASPNIGTEANGDEEEANLDSSEDPHSGEEMDGESAEYWAFIAATEERELTEESQLEEVGSQGDLEYTEGAEFYNGEDAATDGNDLAGANDVLDLDHAQWAVNPELGQDAVDETATTHEDDHIDIQDEEDDVAGYIAGATSSAADPTTASSIEAHEVSAQGHKRSLDEAEHGVDIAPDSIDAKRARV